MKANDRIKVGEGLIELTVQLKLIKELNLFFLFAWDILPVSHCKGFAAETNAILLFRDREKISRKLDIYIYIYIFYEKQLLEYFRIRESWVREEYKTSVLKLVNQHLFSFLNIIIQ